MGFQCSSKPWEYEGTKEKRWNGTDMEIERDMDRWMIMGFCLVQNHGNDTEREKERERKRDGYG